MAKRFIQPQFSFEGRVPLTSPIVLVTGAAPYLGGPQTWKPLREAAPSLPFREVDLFDVAIEPDPLAAAGRAIEAAVADASALVVHGSAAAIALGTVENARPGLPVMLLSPIVINGDSGFMRILRGLAASPAGRLLNAVAASKTRKLRADPAFVREQLEMLMDRSAISGALLEEARERVADPRMASLAKHMAQTLVALLTPSAVFESFRGVALYGRSAVDRKNCERLPGTVLQESYAAPMLEAPGEVAKHLHKLLEPAASISPA